MVPWNETGGGRTGGAGSGTRPPGAPPPRSRPAGWRTARSGAGRASSVDRRSTRRRGRPGRRRGRRRTPSRWRWGMDLAVRGRRPARGSRPRPAGSTRATTTVAAVPSRVTGGDEDAGGQVGLGDGAAGARAGATRRRRARRRRPAARSSGWRRTSVSAAREPDRRRPPPRGASAPAARRPSRSARAAGPRGRRWPTAGPAPRPGPVLEDEAQLGEPEARPAVLLGDGQAEQVGLGQLRPQLAVEAVVGALDLGHPLGGRHAGEDAPRPPRPPPAAPR